MQITYVHYDRRQSVKAKCSIHRMCMMILVADINEQARSFSIPTLGILIIIDQDSLNE